MLIEEEEIHIEDRALITLQEETEWFIMARRAMRHTIFPSFQGLGAS